VGWLDVYSKNLPDQWIDITGIPDGEYWLESESDPDDAILESDETNNITRIKVIIGTPDPINPDAYEPDDSRAQVDGRPVAQPSSPNLGPCNPQLVIDSLTVHESGNDDYYRFYMNSTGTTSDFVRIDFTHANGDLDMHLLDSDGTEVGVSQTITNREEITLNILGEGWYYVHVYGYNGQLNPDYTLTIDPPANSPPVIDVLTPPVGDTGIIFSVETYTTTWAHSDPENDDMWVTTYINTSPVLDGNEIPIASTVNTDAAQGFSVINTAYATPGTYWVYCSITDGGTTTGDWSDGTITFLEQDPDSDGVPIPNDNCPYYPNPTQETCGPTCELSGDGVIDNVDLNMMIDYLFFNAPNLIVDPGCPHVNRGDATCDGVTDTVDLNVLIDFIFFNGGPMCDPCACLEYPAICP
jgi:hypothetical protein